MKKVLAIAAIGYLGVALATRAKESRGELTCACTPECWCKQPGLSLFRWVFPYGHKTAID